MHYLSWALFELSWSFYFAGDLDGAISAGEESLRVGGRLAGATMPSAGGGPGWVLAVSRFELGDVDGALDLMREVGGDDMGQWIPAEQCFNWENMALGELTRGRRGGRGRLRAAIGEAGRRDRPATPHHAGAADEGSRAARRR